MNKKNTKKFKKRLGDNEKILNPFNTVFLIEDKYKILLGDNQHPKLIDTYKLNKNVILLVYSELNVKDKKIKKLLGTIITKRKVVKNREYKTKILHLYVKILEEKIIGMEDINE